MDAGRPTISNVATALILSCALARVALAQGPPSPCAAGPFDVVAERVRPKSRPSPASRVRLGPTSVEIPGLCGTVAPKKFKANQRGVTKVLAKWSGCGGVAGKVRLAGKIVDQCGRFVGNVTGPRLRWRIEAARGAGFRDLVYQQQAVSGLPGSDVVLDGTLAVDAAGQPTGEVLATYAAGGVARVVAGAGFVVVEIGDQVLDVRLDDSEFLRLEGAEQRALGIGEAMAAFEADARSGRVPTTWAVSSQALLVLGALASTPDWTANLEAGSQVGAAFARYAPLGLSSYIPSFCKVTALTFQAIAAAPFAVLCAAECAGSIVVPVIGQLSCTQFIAICAALGTGATESVHDAVYAVCGERRREAPTSRVRLAVGACGCRVVSGGAARELELDWTPRDADDPPQLPLSLVVTTPTGSCPSGVLCPSGSAVFGNQVQTGGSLSIPDVIRCGGTVEEPTTIPVEAFIREAGDGRESTRMRFDVRCVPACGEARAPLCGGDCPVGRACQATASGCACVAGDRPTCGTDPVCTDSLCPDGERCSYLLGGCGCLPAFTLGEEIPDLPRGNYQLFFSVPGQIGPTPVGSFVLQDADAFRQSLVMAIEQLAAAYSQHPLCTSRYFSTPFDGQLFTLTVRITCQDDDGPVVTDVVFELRRVS